MVHYHKVELEAEEWDALELPPAAAFIEVGASQILYLAETNIRFADVMKNYVSAVRHMLTVADNETE